MAHGTTVIAPARPRGTPLDAYTAEFTQPTLEVLAVPELAFLLAALGMLGLACWLAAPALMWRGAAGTVLLTAGATGLATLPISAAGTLLLILAAASLCMEVLAYPGFGLHATGGATGLILAGLFLEGQWSGAHPGIVIPVCVAVATLTFLAGRHSRRRTRSDPFTSAPTLTGQHAIVLQADGTQGHAVVCGELWTIRTRRNRLREGQTVRVTETADACLTVEQISPQPRPGTR